MTMNRVMIWGTGKTATKALHYIKKEVEIVGFVDSNAEKGQVFFDKPVLSPRELTRGIAFDLLIICSIYKTEILKQLEQLAINQEKVFWWSEEELGHYFIYKKDFFHKKLDDARKNKSPRILITGISYHNDGILAEAFQIPTLNFAMRGQDLFYDFEVVKYLHHIGLLDCLKYSIIGLCYYSFELDLSKTGNKWEILRYYPEIQSAHNVMDEAYWGKYCENEIKMWEAKDAYQLFEVKTAYDFTDEIGRKAAKEDFNKNYPITVFENRCILDEYLNFLEEIRVKPIIVIMPATDYYTKYCDSEIKRRFYKNLQDVIGKREIQILDYFDQCAYPDHYYYHINHLNRIGAEVFTKQLERDILW